MEILGYGRVDRRQLSHYLRTGIILPPESPEDEPVAQKYNHFHDPEDGRFAFRGSGVPDRRSGGVSEPSGNQGADDVIRGGPFGAFSSRGGPAGRTARAIDRLMSTPGSSGKLELDKETILDIKRLDGNRIEISAFVGSFQANGYFEHRAGEARVILVVESWALSPLAKLAGAKLTSFPTRIAIYANGGRLLYSRNEPIVGVRPIGVPFRREAGIFRFAEKD